MLETYRKIKPKIGKKVYLAKSADIIGDVTIGDESSIWPQVVIRGDVNHIRIGRNTNVQDGTVIHVTHPYAKVPAGHAVIVGDDVTIGHQVTLHGCTLQDLCLVGMGSIVLDGAVIESGVMLGAGSLVPPHKVLTSGFLWLGSPVKQVRPLTQEERDWIAYSAKHYVNLKNTYLGGKAKRKSS